MNPKLPRKGTQPAVVLNYFLHPETIPERWKKEGGWVNGQFFIRGNDGEWHGFTQFHAVIHTLENKYNWKFEHSEFTDGYGFRSYRLLTTPVIHVI